MGQRQEARQRLIVREPEHQMRKTGFYHGGTGAPDGLTAVEGYYVGE